MSTDRAPYQRQKDRRVARARKLISDTRAALDLIERELTGPVIPDAGGLEAASRLATTLMELSAQEELAEDLEVIPSFQERAAEYARQRLAEQEAAK